MSLRFCSRALVWFLVSFLVFAPSAFAQSKLPTIIPAVGAGIGIGIFLNQTFNNSANNSCKGCQNVDAAKPNYCANISCSTTESGYTVSGKCGAPGQCRATNAQGLGGSNIQLGTIMQVVGLVASLAQLTQQQSAPAPAPGVPYQYGCSTYYYVTSTSSDPCAIYSPTPVSQTIASTPISDFSTDAGISGNSIAEQLRGLANDTSASTTTGTNVDPRLAQLAEFAPSAASSTTMTGVQKNASTTEVITTELREGGLGTTFVANLKSGLSEVAGFFGSNVPNEKSGPFLVRFCAKRSWAAGWVASIIPPSFFDAVCARLGFQVGAVERVDVAPQQSFGRVKATVVPTQVFVAPKAPAEVDIWAEPASVRLGARGKIFWRSKNVDSCRISGPSFEQDSLSGGGATVPITGPTIFTIVCEVPGGEPVRDGVTINLAI